MDTKFQKKFESDMTRKERRELEREKLASMNFKGKLEYILTYYKYHILGVILIILLGIGIVKWADTLKDEAMIYVGFINAASEGEGMMEDFKEQQEDSNGHHKYELDTSIYFSESSDGVQADYSSQMKLVTLVGAGTVDVFICPEDTYEQYKEEGVVYSVEELMGEEFVQKHQDICEDNAVRVEDSAALEKYGLSGDTPAYLIVFSYTRHPEVAKEFVRFITE